MKVLQVLDNLYLGGAERVFVNLCNWLDEKGVEVIPAILVGTGLDLLDEIHTRYEPVVLGRKKRWDIDAASQLADLMKGVDLVHVHMRHNYRYVKLVQTIFNVKTKMLIHDHSSFESVPFGFKWLFKPQYYIGVSERIKNWAERNFQSQIKESFLLENTIEVCTSLHEAPSRDLVLVSNIKPNKNQQFALEVAKARKLSLDFYGQIQNADYYQKLKNIVEGSLDGIDVRFIHDCMNIQPVLGHYRLGLHVSLRETGPLVIMEYLAQGLPFLAYYTGEVARIVSREFPKYFINSFELDAWCARIEQLMAEKADSEKMMVVFEKHFGKEIYIEKCLNIYKKVLRS